MEQIYTIPVNEAFEKVRDEQNMCPFCLLYNRLEAGELDLILGASAMEPDVRIRTNELGFCDTHFGLMFKRSKRLPLALMMESLLGEGVAKDMEGNMGMFIQKTGEAVAKKMEKRACSCYVCERIENNFTHMLETAALLWQSDSAFQEKAKAAPYFCVPHYGRFLRAAKDRLSKKDFAEFFTAMNELESGYLKELNGDVTWFCKKFDYRYENEPWGNAKDAPERARLFLTGNLHVHEEDLKKNDGGLT